MGGRADSGAGGCCSGWRTGGWWCRGDSVREYWAIYRALAGAYVRSRLQYRLSFWLGVSPRVSADLVPLLLMGIIFTRFPSIHGWGWRDIALLYGLDQLSFGLSRCFSRQIDNFDNYIVSGRFRQLPGPAAAAAVPPAGRAVRDHGARPALRRRAWFSPWRRAAAGVPFTAGNVAIALAAAVGGAMLLFSFLLMVATVSFWHTRSGKLQDMVQASGRAFAGLPAHHLSHRRPLVPDAGAAAGAGDLLPRAAPAGPERDGRAAAGAFRRRDPDGAALSWAWRGWSGGLGCGIIRAPGREPVWGYDRCQSMKLGVYYFPNYHRDARNEVVHGPGGRSGSW